MSIRNALALLLTVVSVGLLIPGLLLPMLSISIDVEIPILGGINIYQSKLSVIGTIKNLHNNNNTLVAFLILLFSIIIPIAKSILFVLQITLKGSEVKVLLQEILGIIGKWSMADVFIVALFVAHLSTSSENSISTNIHEGFYYFLSYCIVSILGFQLAEKVKIL